MFILVLAMHTKMHDRTPNKEGHGLGFCAPRLGVEFGCGVQKLGGLGFRV